MKRLSVVASASSAVALTSTRTIMRPELFEGPLDLKAGEKGIRKGPPTAHSLPVYKSTHKLHNSARWKTANLVANVAGGKDFRLRETHGEGTLDETGHYRDWLYGDDRRYANYLGLSLGALSLFLFYYTIKVMSSETWDIPAPALAAKNLDGTKKSEDALKLLKKPATASKIQDEDEKKLATA